MTKTTIHAWLIATSILTFGCKNGGGGAVAKLADFKDQMCKCTDKACADKVNAEMATWSEAMAKTAEPSEDDRKQIKAVGKQLQACMAKATGDGTAANTPSSSGKAITADQWLAIRQSTTPPKAGELVTVTYHTAKDEGAPCYETNEPGNKWTCMFSIHGKNPDGTEDSDSVRLDHLDKAQTTLYMTKVKPDVDVTLTCKVNVRSVFPELDACQ